MDHVIIEAVEEFISTPWVYLAALLAITKLDGFFPVVPSETLVITLGVFAASHSEPNLFLIILIAAIGAFAGDHISYLIGYKAGPRVMSRFKEGSRARKAYDRVGVMLKKRGGLVLITARYIPGGRTAATPDHRRHPVPAAPFLRLRRGRRPQLGDVLGADRLHRRRHL